MRFTTKTEYGFVCLVYMARKASGDLVTVKEIAQREHFSATYIEKIMQHLRAAHIVVSHQGKEGGYSLARAACEITLKDVIEALEGSTFEVFCEPQVREHIVCTHFCLCGITPIWKKTKKVLDDFFGSMTLEMMAKDARKIEHLMPQAG
ncbi:MAG: Rrf2 family transcriptional regulator [Chlamydiae bacterium]|nr:Rrf2 family transcriptional regulator [Chlamydiota bacterium]MBI3266207.1 Rrf2 family transcriptional regulator [Chlamydiota bacterium]